MGNNQAYEIWEETVIHVYNAGVLDRTLLEKLSRIHEGTDIDSCGSRDLRANDGLGAVEVTLNLYGKKLPPKPKLLGGYSTWTQNQRDLYEQYVEKRSRLFSDITNKIWGWG